MQIDKSKVINTILDTLYDIDGVESVTIAGSFIDHPGSSDYSDIDTIVIVNKLTPTLFQKCVTECHNLQNNPALGDKKVFVNSTFGPLKFDEDDNIVIHLMVYDVEGHVNHVIRSPFTCLDWERSKVFRGKKLAEICSVGRLCLRDFSNSRRGIHEYQDELNKGVLSYRYYTDIDGMCVEQSSHLKLDNRAKAEFIFHIIKNSIQNLNKLITTENVLLSESAALLIVGKFYVDPHAFLDKFTALKKAKYEKRLVYDDALHVFCMDFLEKFNEYVEYLEKNLHKIYFIRHAETELNDGRFLGQKLDPDIKKQILGQCEGINADKIYCSPLKRSRSSARLISESDIITIDERLTEIDYGEAEGMDIEKLKLIFPNVVSEWEKGNDPCFPNGENQASVLTRLKAFISENYLQSNKPLNSGCSAVITHNIVLRSLIGNYFNIPIESWYKISIPHMSPIEAVVHKNTLLLNCDREILKPVSQL